MNDSQRSEGSRDSIYAAPAARLETAPSADIAPLFSFRGRLGRIQYLAWSMALTLSFYALVAVTAVGVGAGLAAAGSVFAGNPDLDTLGVALVVIYGGSVLLLLPLSVMLIVKRLHDFNQSGWLSLLIVVPVINMLFFLALVLVPGKDPGNRFGSRAETRTWHQVVGLGGLAVVILVSVAPALLAGVAGA